MWNRETYSLETRFGGRSCGSCEDIPARLSGTNMKGHIQDEFVER